MIHTCIIVVLLICAGIGHSIGGTLGAWLGALAGVVIAAVAVWQLGEGE